MRIEELHVGRLLRWTGWGSCRDAPCMEHQPTTLQTFLGELLWHQPREPENGGLWRLYYSNDNYFGGFNQVGRCYHSLAVHAGACDPISLQGWCGHWILEAFLLSCLNLSEIHAEPKTYGKSDVFQRESGSRSYEFWFCVVGTPFDMTRMAAWLLRFLRASMSFHFLVTFMLFWMTSARWFRQSNKTFCIVHLGEEPCIVWLHAILYT